MFASIQYLHLLICLILTTSQLPHPAKPILLMASKWHRNPSTIIHQVQVLISSIIRSSSVLRGCGHQIPPISDLVDLEGVGADTLTFTSPRGTCPWTCCPYALVKGGACQQPITITRWLFKAASGGGRKPTYLLDCCRWRTSERLPRR